MLRASPEAHQTRLLSNSDKAQMRGRAVASAFCWI
jgi:hypothetical protein